jgi:hypothetical protein
MSSSIYELHQLWHRSCRFALRLFGLCLLPWARASDFIAVFITTRYVRLQPFTWHIAAIILGSFVLTVAWHAVAHILTWAFFTDIRGYLAPCVCEACLQCAGRQAQPDSNLALMFIALLELLQALVKATLAVSKVLCEFCSVVLTHPRLSTAVLITAGSLATLL